IESRKRGRLSSLSMERPAQSMAMQTGISTIPRVFRRNLNADSQAMVLVLALSIGPIRQDCEYRADPTRLKGEERVPPLPAHRLLRAAGRPSLGGPAGKARVDRLDVPASVRQPLRLR